MILDAIKRMFERSFDKQWYETYWAMDLHGTIIKPNYKDSTYPAEYYPYARRTLQLLTKRPDIKLILWTSSYPHEIKEYVSKFAEDDIVFDAINKNPEISDRNGNYGYYDDKFYFNVLFDDKAGFNPDTDWLLIYDYLIKAEEIGFMPNPNWTTKH